MLRSIIQGGMGIGVSNPNLAKAVAMAGGIGTVSCTAAERTLANTLQFGDLDGSCRRAMAHFPFPEVVERVLARWYREGGIGEDEKLKVVPMFTFRSRPDLIELAVLASFAFVWLAKEGHNNPISVNYLEKLQIGHVYHLTGAMLAEVDYVTMGAGIPLHIPDVLNTLAVGGDPSYSVDVKYSTSQPVTFSPREFFGEKFPREMKRPGFFPIISTDALANVFMKKMREPEKNIDAFVVELPTAGGHNAPPRGQVKLYNDKGEPIYGERDAPNWEKIRGYGIPFYIAGSHASPQHLAEAQADGAVGVQCGTLFKMCDESGEDPEYRARQRYFGFRGELDIFTDPRASPTGYPFKVPQLAGTISDQAVYEARTRDCSIQALQFPELHDGKIRFLCPAEPIEDYLRKGGKIEETVGRKCLCNGLYRNVGLANRHEKMIFTSGDDYSFLPYLMEDEFGHYSAAEAVNWMLSVAKAA